jgi:hypothetical protein
MKNRLYPTWDEIEKFHKPLTEGEEKLARFLDDTLPEEWKGLGNLDAFVYTAMTRTRENLIVLNCNKRYVEYGKSLPSE